MATRKRSQRRTKIWCSFVETAPGKWRLASGDGACTSFRRKKPRRRRKLRVKMR